MRWVLINSLFFSSPVVNAACPLNPFRLNERLLIQRGLFMCPGSVEDTFENNLLALPWEKYVSAMTGVTPNGYGRTASTDAARSSYEPARAAMVGVHMRISGLILASVLAGCAGDSQPRGFYVDERVVHVDGMDLQRAIDEALPHSVVRADRTEQIEISLTVQIDKPLTLVGLNARLKPRLGDTPILEVLAEGVRLRDFLLEGKADSVEQSERAPLAWCAEDASSSKTGRRTTAPKTA